MPSLSKEAAILTAREALATTDLADARVVERFDRPGQVYYLVLFGGAQATSAIAAVDAQSGSLMGAARLSGSGPHLQIEREQATRLSSLSEPHARLVWQPCRASLSPLYPLWQITGTNGEAFVDQQGKCWPSLSPAHA